MSLKTLALIGGLGYVYMYLKNNQILSNKENVKSVQKIQHIDNGGVITTKSNIPEVLVNTLPGSNTKKYQLIYDIVYDNHRYTLYVLKDWVRKDIPKPFISQSEYDTLTDIQKQKYNLNQSKAGNYKWYQVDKMNGNYNTIQNAPLSLENKDSITNSLIAKSLPLGFIPVYSYNDQKPTTETYGQAVNIITPVTPSTTNNIEVDTNLGITVPLYNLQQFKQLLHNYGIVDIYKVSSEFLNGIQVEKYVVKPTINVFETIYEEIKDSGIVYDVKKLITSPSVKSANIYHPDPIASQI